jgi:prevent-host-death family protein
MEIVNIHFAKTNLSRLVERATNGEQIIIAKAGNPVAKLTAYRQVAGRRKPGIWKGKVVLADHFDSLPRSVASAFRGEEP